MLQARVLVSSFHNFEVLSLCFTDKVSSPLSDAHVLK